MQTQLHGRMWSSLEMPFPLSGSELAFVRYDTLAPFWVDDAGWLPDNLIAAFPPVP